MSFVSVTNENDDHFTDEETEREQWHLGDYIPSSWLDESGVRHAVVWDEDIEVRWKIVNGEAQLIGLSVF